VIPVAACDLQGKPANESNLAGSFGKRGLLAPGVAVPSLGTGGQPVAADGTSAAAPFVTGTIALLWSEFPATTAADMRCAVAPVARCRKATIVPRLLDALAAYELLRTNPKNGRQSMQQAIEAVGHPVDQSADLKEATGAPSGPPTRTEAAVAPQSAGGKCGCSGGGAGAAEIERSYVYALGQVRPRFPTPAVEKEFAQATGRAGTAGLTDGQALHAVLTQPANRYLVRQLCWVFSTGGVETYLLQPRDPGDFQLLVEAIRPSPRPTDVDVVIGSRGPVASPGMCNGLMLPIVYFDQIYSFDVESLIKTIPAPEKIGKEQFAPMAEELFWRTLQIADNAGGTDEHRALNYLAVRYDALYAKAAECFGRNCALTAVDVRPSALVGARKLMEVVLTFSHRETDIAEKCMVRVDVTEEFPFIVSKLTPWYDR
jgi:hypothetical protein